MTTWTDCYHRQTSIEEQQLYEHLLHWVQEESPSRMIERFRQLFMDGVGYSEPRIWMALERIASSKQAEQEFRFIINRCCHILINRWQMHPQLQASIPDLVDIFEHPPSVGTVRSRSARRFRELVRIFNQTEQYLTLRRLAQVMTEAAEANGNGSKPLGSLIRRYPYLYEHCLLSEDSSYEHQQTVRAIQSRIQRDFEVDLSQYVTYQVRRAQMSRKASPVGAERIIQPVHNPTLLSDRELGVALKQFVGKVEGSHTYRDLSQSFITHTSQTPSYRAFKWDLYEYLTSSIDPEYGKRQFNDRLYAQLKNTLPSSDCQRPSEFLIVRTCSQILNFLVVESPQRPNHYVFVDLITNLGATCTIGMLLKIVLLCRKVKPYLEKRFSILFNHYEAYARDGVPWLVKSLENMNVALSLHFGDADVSCLSHIM
ncbi:hypothetical protein H6F61_12540 [Cyanobacteria bacterium FACHB-472]|nr:hypothetical protein [Cyanobacteria bacterium FACHB-472]